MLIEVPVYQQDPEIALIDEIIHTDISGLSQNFRGIPFEKLWELYQKLPQLIQKKEGKSLERLRYLDNITRSRRRVL